MSDSHKQQVAPGIARAMRNVRNASTLSNQRNRALRRWTLPSEHDDGPNSESASNDR